MGKSSTYRFKAWTWDEVCADPYLRNAPFKVELNGLNQIVMAPIYAQHSRHRSKIMQHLQRLLREGESISGLPLMTADNVKPVDVVWASRATIKTHHDEASCWSTAPEICVSVFSPTNTEADVQFKRYLYFERGAREVWACGVDGKMKFYSSVGEMKASALCPKFPSTVKL